MLGPQDGFHVLEGMVTRDSMPKWIGAMFDGREWGVGERESGGETERAREGDSERQRDRETGRQRESETASERVGGSALGCPDLGALVPVASWGKVAPRVPAQRPFKCWWVSSNRVCVCLSAHSGDPHGACVW